MIADGTMLPRLGLVLLTSPAVTLLIDAGFLLGSTKHCFLVMELVVVTKLLLVAELRA